MCRPFGNLIHTALPWLTSQTLISSILFLVLLCSVYQEKTDERMLHTMLSEPTEPSNHQAAGDGRANDQRQKQTGRYDAMIGIPNYRCVPYDAPNRQTKCQESKRHRRTPIESLSIHKNLTFARGAVMHD